MRRAAPDLDSEHFVGLVGCRIKNLEMEAQELLFSHPRLESALYHCLIFRHVAG